MSYQRSKRVEAKLADNRTQILRAARKLVSEGGWAEAQMASIAATANLATGTIYRYFPSKADLLAEVLSIVSQREVDVIEGIASTGGSAKQRLADTVGAFVARAFRGRRLAYALIAEPCDPEIDQARLAYRRAIGEQFQEIIAEGVAGGEFPSQDPSLAAACTVGAMMEALVGPLEPAATKVKDGGEVLVVQVVQYCLRAVTAPEVRLATKSPKRIVKKKDKGSKNKNA